MAKKTETVTPNRLVKFEQKTMMRSEIKEAPYNPRAMDADTEEALRRVLEEHGLVEPLVFNKRSGHLVGGHQRIHQMDAILGREYEVPVAVIDVDEEEEKKLNILLNNPSIQGEWDIPKLEEMFRNGINPWDLEFTNLDLLSMLPQETAFELADLYLPEDQQAAMTLPGEADEATVSELADEIAQIKEARKEHKLSDSEDIRSDHMIVVVFESADDTARALTQLRLDPGTRFYMADKFFAAVQSQQGKVVFHQQPKTEEKKDG